MSLFIVPEFEFSNTKYIVNETSNTEVCVRTVPGGSEVGPDVAVTISLTVRNTTALGKWLESASEFLMKLINLYCYRWC